MKMTNNKKGTMLSILGLALASPMTTQAALVFSDDFSTAGAIAGSTPDVGAVWGGTGTFASVGGALDLTTGAQTNNNVNFTAALAAGEVLTATVDVTAMTAGAWGGVSLFTGANASAGEIGITNQGSSWGVDVNTAAGTGNDFGNVLSGQLGAGTITFVYDFDSGDYTWTGPGGGAIATGDNEDLQAGLTFQSIRIADSNNGSFFTVEGITVDISSAVPEPSSALLSLAGLGLGLLRRRRR